MNDASMTRRDCMKRAAALAATAAFGCAAAERAGPAAEVRNYNPAMGYRRLGRTGLLVSEIGLGGHCFYKGEQYTTQERRNEVVAACLDAGVNFFETTEVPGEDETTGEALRGERERVYITHDFATMREGEEWSREETRRRCMECIETGLRNFHTDCIDIWRPSARQAGGTSMRLTEWVLEAGLEAQRQGKVRFLGISAHDAPWLVRTVTEFDVLDLVITPYNYCFRQAERELFPLVRARDLGLVAIKPFLGESLFRREIPQWNREQEPEVGAHEGEYARATAGRSADELALAALKFILARPEISVVIPGMSTAQEVRNDVRAARSYDLARGEMRALESSYARAASRLPDHLRWLDGWRLA